MIVLRLIIRLKLEMKQVSMTHMPAAGHYATKFPKIELGEEGQRKEGNTTANIVRR